MNDAAAHRAAGQAIAALIHGTLIEALSVDGIEVAADVAAGKWWRAELLVEIAIGLAGIGAEARFGFGHSGPSDLVVSWRFTRGQIEDFHTVHEMVDELDPAGTQDVFFCAWKQALDLVGDRVFWDAIETLAAELRHGELSRDEIARIANEGFCGHQLILLKSSTERMDVEKGRPMPGKRVQLDEETWAAIDLLAQDTMADFQELADEAFRDLLAKHGRPLGLKDQLQRSLRSDVKAEGAISASGTPSSGRKKTPARTAKRGRENDAARPRSTGLTAKKRPR